MTQQTWRNSNRNLSRNSAGLKRLFAQSPALVQTGFYYQYCANRHCRKLEAAILSGKQRNFSSALREMLIDAGAAVMTVEHVTEDVKQEFPITLKTQHEDESSSKIMGWDDFSNILAYLHLAHATSSRFKGCGSYEKRHLGYARDSANDEDLSISNVLRDVPGVRHLDVDGIFLCPQCLKPQLLIEATSDGYENGGVKSTYMTERLAELFAADFALVQHAWSGEITNLVVTQKVRVADSSSGHYTKSSSLMKPDEFLDFVEKEREHRCDLPL